MKKFLIFLLLIGYADAQYPFMVFNKDMPTAYGYCNELDGCKYLPKSNPLPYLIVTIVFIISVVLTLNAFIKKISNMEKYKVVNR